MADLKASGVIALVADSELAVSLGAGTLGAGALGEALREALGVALDGGGDGGGGGGDELGDAGGDGEGDSLSVSVADGEEEGDEGDGEEGDDDSSEPVKPSRTLADISKYNKQAARPAIGSLAAIKITIANKSILPKREAPKLYKKRGFE